MLSRSDFSTIEDQDQDFEVQKVHNPEGELHLRFLITSGHEVALPAVGIREILAPSPERITPIPNVSPLLLGILNLRGQIVWVADIGQFLGDTPLNTDRSEIPVITIESQELTIGLAVDQVIGMDWLNLEQIRPPTNIPSHMAPFLKGEWIIDETSHRCLQLLDYLAILRSARWVT